MVQEQSQYGMLKHKHLPQKLLAINTLNISITFHLAEWKMQSWGKTRGKERLGGLRGSSGSSYSLVNDQVWSKAQQVAIGLLVGPPAQSKSHQEHPGVLQQGHLVIQVQIPETWRNKNWQGMMSGVKKQQKWLGKGAGPWAALSCYQCTGSDRDGILKNPSAHVWGYLGLMGHSDTSQKATIPVHMHCNSLGCLPKTTGSAPLHQSSLLDNKWFNIKFCSYSTVAHWTYKASSALVTSINCS